MKQIEKTLRQLNTNAINDLFVASVSFCIFMQLLIHNV